MRAPRLPPWADRPPPSEEERRVKWLGAVFTGALSQFGGQTGFIRVQISCLAGFHTLKTLGIT